jgi:hypothetical protein
MLKAVAPQTDNSKNKNNSTTVTTAINTTSPLVGFCSSDLDVCLLLFFLVP